MCTIAPAPPSAYLGALPDDRLVALYRAGADDAFAELDRRHRKAVCGFVGRSLRGRGDAEDVAQDVMLRAARQLRAGADPVLHLRAWLLRVARNRVIDLVRAARPAEELPEAVPARDDLAADSAARDELAHALVALRTLPERQRQALVLNAVHGVPFEAVAQVLDTTPRAAKMMAFRGRTTMRRQLAA